MENEKEVILKLFKSGGMIKGITDLIYSQMKEKEKTKGKSERIKVVLRDVKNMVEQTVYESCISEIKQQHIS